MFKRGTWQDLTTFLQCYLANWASSSLNFSQNGTSPRLLSKQNVLYFLKYWADGQFQTICIEMKKDLHRHIIFLVMNMLTLEHILPLAQCYNCETCIFHVIILLLKLTGKLLSFFFFFSRKGRQTVFETSVLYYFILQFCLSKMSHYKSGMLSRNETGMA